MAGDPYCEKHGPLPCRCWEFKTVDNPFKEHMQARAGDEQIDNLRARVRELEAENERLKAVAEEAKAVKEDIHRTATDLMIPWREILSGRMEICKIRTSKLRGLFNALGAMPEKAPDES